MDIKVVDDAGKEIVEEKHEFKEPDTTVMPTGELMVQRMAQMFDLKPTEISQYKSKLNVLIDYAKSKSEDHSPEGIKWAIRNLEIKLGTPPLGENRIAYLTRYAFLALDRDKIDSEMGNYER